MAEINAAWTLLRDPIRRATWDRAHGIRSGARAYNGSAAPGADPAGRPTSAGQRPTTATWRRGPRGEGAAGPPPGNPRGSVLPFGRHIGWSLGEIARVDPGYLAWLASRDEGRPYRAEIEALLEAIRLRTADPDTRAKKRGRFG